MEFLHTDDIERLGIKGRTEKETHDLYHKMVKWGWIDGLGRQLAWRFWQRKSARD